MWNELKNREEAGRIKEDAFNNFNPLMKIVSKIHESIYPNGWDVMEFSFGFKEREKEERNEIEHLRSLPFPIAIPVIKSPTRLDEILVTYPR